MWTGNGTDVQGHERDKNKGQPGKGRELKGSADDVDYVKTRPCSKVLSLLCVPLLCFFLSSRRIGAWHGPSVRKYHFHKANKQTDKSIQ